MTKPLSPDQQAALNKLIDFTNDPLRKVFVFLGFAGTGKTFTMEAFASHCLASEIPLHFTATTNKAAKVLAERTGDAQTVHQFLGLKPSKHEGELIFGKGSSKRAGILVVDEASMADEELYDSIMAHRGQIVFLLDAAQLPPIGEEQTQVLLRHSPDVKLTKVERHDNQILKVVTAIREAWEGGARVPTIVTDMGDESGVYVHQDHTRFCNHIGKAAKAGAFSSDACRVIAWRNRTVDAYNEIIRNVMYNCPDEAFVVGERIVTAAAIRRTIEGKEKTILNTATELLVRHAVNSSMDVKSNNIREDLVLRTAELVVEEPFSRLEYHLTVLDPKDKWKFDNLAQKLRKEKRWYELHRLQDLLDDVKYAYALTAHRAQGSTYRTVWVDMGDILDNPKRDEALQCLYVATSRPTNFLHLL